MASAAIIVPANKVAIHIGEESILEFMGDNGAYGAERVEINAERYVDPVVESGEGFPFGIRGLLPVMTSRKKKGGFKEVFAFPCANGVLVANEELVQELADALGFVNLLLSEASELSGYPFGAIEAVQMGVTGKGYGFTRVEEAPLDGPSATPIHLRIETSEKQSEPGSVSVVMEYDAHGYVQHVLMTKYGEAGHVCRAIATVDFYDGEVRIQKVVETPAANEEPVELYFWR